MLRHVLAAALTLAACAALAGAWQEGPAAPGKYANVVAEGVGLTVEDARKDAFRNAVRQAAGALIDAETFVQNEQVIKDQVLAYSNAMVKSYKEVGKPQQEGGLYRVTILAAVERLGLERRVAKAKESFQKVPGESLYARFVKELGDEKAQQLTDAERRQAAREMMEKLLEGFPINCLEATLVGPPRATKREGDTITFQVAVLVKPNLKAFDDFAGRLTARLEKMARDKDEFGIRAEVNGKGWLQFDGDWGRLMGRRFETTGQGIRYRSKGTCVVAVNTSRTKIGDRTAWKYYELDDSVRYPLASAASCVLTLKLGWVGKDGTVKETERIPAVVEDGNTLLTLVVPGSGNRFHPSATAARGFYKPNYDYLVEQEEQEGPDRRLYLLSPFFHFPNWGAMYVPQAVLTREYTLSVDDVRELKGFKCELRFEDDTYQDLPPKVKADK